MVLNYLWSYLYTQVSLKVKPKFFKILFVTIIISLLAGTSQSAPIPVRREIWNPYYYPTARSLSIPPTTKTTTTAATTTTTTRTTHRPWMKQITTSANLSAERRASHSLNSTSFKVNMKAPASTGKEQMPNLKDQFKFDLGNVTAIRYALNDFIKSAEVLVRELLISTNSGLLRVVGQVDQGIVKFQRRLQGTGLRLALAGQKAAAQTYEALPPFVNKLIQRLGTPTSEGRSREQLTVQLNDAVKNLRQLKKMLSDALDEHEKDFHDVFQDRFSQVNQYLGVPELPKRPLAWYS